jgi:hypothetical protein
VGVLAVVGGLEVRVIQRCNDIEIDAITHGNPLERGGYSWRGEMRPRVSRVDLR